MGNVVPRRHILLKKKIQVPSIEYLPMSGRPRTPTIVLYDIVPDCQLELTGMTL